MPRRPRCLRSAPKAPEHPEVIGIFLVILFPAIYYYFSPYISMMGAAQGVIAGSVFLFALLLLSALVVGRAFCGWACPAGALMDLVATGRPKPVRRARLYWIKYLIWAPWLATLLLMTFQHRGSIRPTLCSRPNGVFRCPRCPASSCSSSSPSRSPFYPR